MHCHELGFAQLPSEIMPMGEPSKGAAVLIGAGLIGVAASSLAVLIMLTLVFGAKIVACVVMFAVAVAILTVVTAGKDADWSLWAIRLLAPLPGVLAIWAVLSWLGL